MPTEEVGPVDLEVSDHLQPGHLRHCFDYLRQSLMCGADTNLEPVKEDLGGVTGWGNPRVCRDHEQLVRWAEEWKIGNTSGIM
jgi:hypothetical protein